MACKQENREIQGKQVSVMQWTAIKALDMQVSMMNTLGETANKFIDGTWDLMHLNFVLTNCERSMFVDLVKQCCIGARIEGEEVSAANFDIKLSGDMLLLYGIFAFVLEVNFKDFFTKGQAIQGVKNV